MNSKKLLRYLIIAAVVIIILAVVGKKAGWFGKSISYDVATEKVEKRNITEVITANGKIQPETEVKLTPDVAGEIVELNVKDGDKVKKGQLLLKIKPDNYISARARIEASVNTAKANLANVKAKLAQAEAQFEQTKLSYERSEKLWKSGTIALSDWESAQASFDMGKADLVATKQNVESAKYQVISSEAALKEADDDLRKTSIYAPMDGTVSVLNVEKGERVAGTSMMAGTDLMSIANLDRMELLVEVNENDIVRVKLQDTALIELDAYLDRKFKGVVTEIANSANTTGTSADQVTNFDVKILLLKSSYQDLITPKDPNPLRPGMSATADIQAQKKTDILTVPIEAVTTRSDSALNKARPDSLKITDDSNESRELVFLYDNGKAKQQLVKTGILDNKYIEITDGLKEGQEVIVAPYNTVSKKLEDGMAVNKVSKEKLYAEDNKK